MAITISGSGQVPVQVQSTTITSQFSTTSSSLVDVTGLSISITPRSASNKILVFATLSLGTTASSIALWTVVRNGTAINIGANGTYNTTGGFYTDTGGAAQGAIVSPSTVYLDSPASTSAVTYKIQLQIAGSTAYVNRRGADNTYNGPSSITVMEIAYA
jgi:hypothetical protein